MICSAVVAAASVVVGRSTVVFGEWLISSVVVASGSVVLYILKL